MNERIVEETDKCIENGGKEKVSEFSYRMLTLLLEGMLRISTRVLLAQIWNAVFSKEVGQNTTIRRNKM